MTLTTISPTTNEAIVTRPSATKEELAAIPRTAQDAFRSFSQTTTLAQRKQIVAGAMALMAKKKDELAKEVTEQMGRPISYTGVEITTAIKRGEYMNRMAEEVLGNKIEADPEPGFSRYLKKHPVGAVLIIFAWNVSPSFVLAHSSDDMCLADDS